jgi:hypothetical protein
VRLDVSAPARKGATTGAATLDATLAGANSYTFSRTMSAVRRADEPLPVAAIFTKKSTATSMLLGKSARPRARQSSPTHWGRSAVADDRPKPTVKVSKTARRNVSDVVSLSPISLMDWAKGARSSMAVRRASTEVKGSGAATANNFSANMPQEAATHSSICGTTGFHRASEGAEMAGSQPSSWTVRVACAAATSSLFAVVRPIDEGASFANVCNARCRRRRDDDRRLLSRRKSRWPPREATAARNSASASEPMPRFA